MERDLGHSTPTGSAEQENFRWSCRLGVSQVAASPADAQSCETHVTSELDGSDGVLVVTEQRVMGSLRHS
jgi:hypothetical protein